MMMCAMKRKSLSTWICALGVTLALGGCGDVSTHSSHPSETTAAANALTTPEVADGVELADRVFWLDMTSTALPSISSDTVEYAAPIPPDVADLGVDDVLVSDVGDGFWRAIERIERSDERIILHTRDAELSEVVENGTFGFTTRSTDEFATRSSALTSNYSNVPRYITPHQIITDEMLGSLDLSTDLAADSRADVSSSNLDVSARGTVSFEPAIRLYFVVARGQIYREHFRVSGWADVDADWTVTSQDTASLAQARRLLSSAGPGNVLEFRLIGRRFQINPDLRIAYEVSSTGQGSTDFGVDGEGYVLAGYDCFTFGSCSALEPETGTTPFSAIEERQLGSGEPNISFKVALLNGLTLLEQGVKTAGVTPLSLKFTARANISPPFCPYEATGTATGISSRQDENFRSYFYDLFDVEQIFTGEDGCAVTSPPSDDDNSSSICLADADCSDGQMCLTGQNRCIDESPLAVTLKWSQSIDLDLRVETASGELLSSTTPTISNGELMVMSAGGTDCDGCIGECTGGVAVDCANETPASGACPSMCDYKSTTDGTCSGSRFTPCAGLSDSECLSADTCILHPTSHLRMECFGIYVDSCDGLDESTCGSSFDCSWSSDTTEWCEGATVDCAELDENTCSSQSACDWELGSSGGGELPPFVEHAAITRANLGDKFRIWVVNTSGSEDDTSSYELLFRTDTGKTFEMRGEFEPSANSQSVFFDYEYQ
jgi:hypothetical protein